MGKLSRAAVLLHFVVVPLCMYTGALLIGIQLGRALERRPDGASFSVREVVDFVAKELWDTNFLQGGRGRGERSWSMQSKRPNTGWSFATPVAQRYNNRNPDYSELQLQTLLQEQKRLFVLQRQQLLKGGRPVAVGGSQRAADVSGRGRDGRSSTLQSAQPYYTRSAAPLPLHSRNDTSLRGVVSVGPWGGSGGQPFHMHGGSAPRLLSIILYHSPGAIHSLACEYSFDGDYSIYRRRLAGPWGRPTSFSSAGLRRASVELSAGEHVTAVEGTTGRFADVPGAVVTSLTFRTSRGRTYGPFGGGGGNQQAATGTTAFSVPVADGACIAGFWGRSGWLLDAIGVYVSPCRYPAYRYTRSSQRQGSGGETTSYYRSSAYQYNTS